MPTDVAGGAVGVAVGAGAAADVVRAWPRPPVHRRRRGSRVSSGPRRCAARLFSGSPPWSFECASGQSVEQGPVLGVEGPCSASRSARGFPGVAVQTAKAVTSWSRVTIPFCNASRPKSRSRGACCVATSVRLPDPRRRAKRRARTRWRIWRGHGAEGAFAHYKEIIGRDGSEWGVRVSTTAWGVPASQGRVRDLAQKARY